MARILNELFQFAKAGVSLIEIEKLATDLLNKNGVKSPFFNYPGEYSNYKYNTCLSVNNTVEHGLPSEYRLKDFDIIKIDTAVLFEGLITDATITKIIGIDVNPFTDEKTLNELLNKDSLGVSANIKKIYIASLNVLNTAINFVKPGILTTELELLIQSEITKAGFYPCKSFMSHGVGHELHEDLSVHNYVEFGAKPVRLMAGMTLALEPILLEKKSKTTNDCLILPDGWTALTTSGGLSSKFEHTILVTDNGSEILTLPK